MRRRARKGGGRQAEVTVEAIGGRGDGLARFEGDSYQLRRSGADAGVPGNPWFLCSLWLAQYEIQSATRPAELEQPLGTLEWVAEHALPSGLLAEQIDPLNGEPASATPLTWAHATFVLTVLEYLEASAKLAPAGSSPGPSSGRAPSPGARRR